MAPEWVVELDSSTPAKFSRHLLVRVPGAAFASNFHAGAFVQSLLDPQPCADPQPAVELKQLLAGDERPACDAIAVAAGPNGSAGSLDGAAVAGPCSMAADAVIAAEATAATQIAQGGSVCINCAEPRSGSASEAHDAAVNCSRQSLGSDCRVQAAQCVSCLHVPSPDDGTCGSACIQGMGGSTEPGSGGPGAAPAGVLQAAGSAGACQRGAADAGAAAAGSPGADAASQRTVSVATCREGAACTAQAGMGESRPSATDPHPSQQPKAGCSVGGVCGAHAAGVASLHVQLLVTKVGTCYRLCLQPSHSTFYSGVSGAPPPHEVDPWEVDEHCRSDHANPHLHDVSGKNASTPQAVQDASGSKTFFVDTGVYTRNRAFRMYLSSKAGKDALLLPTGPTLPHINGGAQLKCRETLRL